MTVMTGKLVSIGGEPFGGPGHAVLIYSRHTRVSAGDDAVILQLIDRIEMPGPDDGGDGTFVTEDMDPGPIRVELEGSSRHGEGWDINLPEPEDGDDQPWSLGSLIGLQVDWDPVVVGRAEAAARESQRHATVSTEQAGIAIQQREHIDTVVYDVMTDAAGMVRDVVKEDADRAERKAGVATEQADLARGHREGAEDAEESAHSAAGGAAEATAALIRGEMDDKVSEAEGHAHLAGLSSEASEASSVTAGGHAQSAGESASAAESHAEAAEGHAQSAGDYQSATAADRATVEQIVDEQIVPIGEQIALDRTAVAQDREATEGARDEAEQHRDDAREAAENAQTGAPPEGWERSDLNEEVRSSLSRADSAMQSMPEATEDARGAVRLGGDLGGTANSPTVPGLAGKSDTGHTHSRSEITDLPEISQYAESGATLVQRFEDGGIQIPEPEYGSDPATVNYVQSQVESRTTPQQVEDQIAAARLPGRWFSGEGPPPPAEDIGAIPGDFWLDEDSMEVHKFEEGQ